jgi:hypothetical protein
MLSHQQTHLNPIPATPTAALVASNIAIGAAGQRQWLFSAAAA